VRESEESLVRRGVELRREGRDEEAAAVLRLAYAQGGSARCAGQLALAEQAIGRWTRAERLLREALAAAEDPWVARNRDVLTGALAVAEQRLATIEIVGGDDGATLWVDGEQAGILPRDRSLRVVVGVVRLEHRSPSGPTLTRVIELAPRAVERVYFAPASGSATVIPPVIPPVIPRVVVAPSRRTEQVLRPHPVLWAGVGVSGASGLALTVAWAVGERINLDFHSQCVDATSVDRGLCAARMREDQQRLDGISRGMDAGWGLLASGLVASGVGVGLSLALPVTVSVSARGEAVVRGAF
jgi:hypothetical protein